MPNPEQSPQPLDYETGKSFAHEEILLRLNGERGWRKDEAIEHIAAKLQERGMDESGTQELVENTVNEMLTNEEITERNNVLSFPDDESRSEAFKKKMKDLGM